METATIWGVNCIYASITGIANDEFDDLQSNLAQLGSLGYTLDPLVSRGLSTMFDENEAQFTSSKDITLGCDLSTFSIEDLDERIALLNAEIERMKLEKANKSDSLNAAHSFFKT